jgi:hypothetical protein
MFLVCGLFIYVLLLHLSITRIKISVLAQYFVSRCTCVDRKSLMRTVAIRRYRVLLPWTVRYNFPENTYLQNRHRESLKSHE